MATRQDELPTLLPTFRFVVVDEFWQQPIFQQELPGQTQAHYGRKHRQEHDVKGFNTHGSTMGTAVFFAKALHRPG